MVFDAVPPVPDMPGLAGRDIRLAKREEIRCDPERHLFDWWMRLAETHQPSRVDFDVIDHRAIAAHFYLIERAEDGFQLRLGGEEYTRIIPRKRGNQWHESSSDPVIRDYAVYLNFVSQRKRPYLGTGRLDLGERNWLNFESLICPLAPANGQPEAFLGSITQID